MNKIVLASQSPRREELLSFLDIDFIVQKSDIDEVLDMSLSPQDIAIDLALQKAKDVAKSYKELLVLGFDTIVLVDGQILGKPMSDEDAKYMLRILSGKKHQVVTGVAIYYKENTESYFVSTDVEFYDIDDNEINQYIQSKEHRDKAGGYAIQGKAAKFVKEIYGDFYNVMGLPVSSLYQRLKKYEK